MALLFAPAEIAAPPARLTLTLPLATVSRTVERLPSGSLTDRPVIASGVSSATLCAPGTALTGGVWLVTLPANSEVLR